MYYVLLNDASLFEVTDMIEETTTVLKGETLKAIRFTVQNADLDLVQTAFKSEFNTRTVTLTSENKVAMSVYDNYTIIRSIGTDMVALTEDPDHPKYIITLAQSSNVADLVPQLQEKIKSLQAELLKLTTPVDPSQMDLDELKEYQIAQSKKNFSEYLEQNPVKSTCHGGVEAQYTCTLEKQTLLNNAIAMVEIHAAMGDTGYKPSWNNHNGECTYDWTKEELVALALDIEAFVHPLLSQQQAMESQIRAASTKEEVNAVRITFPSDIVVNSGDTSAEVTE